MLTIVAPMKSEVSYLRQDPTIRRWLGQWDGAGVQVLVIGVGKEAVQSSLRRWLEAPHRVLTNGSTSNRPDRLLLLGFTGAVDPALICGHLVLSGRYYLDADTPEEVGKGVGDEFFEADSSMLEQAAAAAGTSGLAWHGVESLTVGRLVATGEQKAAIYLSHTRRHSVGVINMEDYWVTEFAARAEIPFLAVRVVIDTAGQAIPSYAMGLQERRLGALASAAARPWQLPNLVRLASNRRVAQRSLRRFAVAFLRDPERLADGLDRGKKRQPIGTR